MRKIIYILMGLLVAQTASAQCGTDEYNKQLIEQQLPSGQSYEQFMENIVNTRFEESSSNDKTKKASRVVPVVFHVVHAYGPENISKEQIEDQMRIINEDFQRTNADASNTRSVFQSRAADFDIEFRLARVDPDGNCTEGITRTYDPINMLEDRRSNRSEVKSAVAPWDPSRYMNVWIVSEIFGDSEGTILGYAQFPWTNSESTDGIVMIHNRVGTIGTANAGDKGRTLTHEIGHWIGLLHTFQSSCFGGDGVSDTPPVSEPSYGCTAGQNPNTCSNDRPNEIDMVENYMDYANGGCMNAFTKGQLDRANGYLASFAGRGSNIGAASLSSTGVNTTPNCGPIADFWYDADYRTVCVGSSVTFNDLSYNGAVTTRTWTFEGATPATSSASDPEVVYNTPGVHKVTLTVANNEGTTTLTRDLFITVRPEETTKNLPYAQDFSAATSTGEWVLQQDAFGYGWQRNTTVGYSGNESLQMKIDEEMHEQIRLHALMPEIDMRDYDGLHNLNFRYAYTQRDEETTEIFFVLASTNCGESWRNIRVLNAVNLRTADIEAGWEPSSPADWKTLTFDLSDYQDEPNLIIRFDVTARQGNSLFIDDINLASFPLSVASYESDVELALVPNPAQNTVTIKTDINEVNQVVSIVDIAGRLLLQQNLDPKNPVINTTDLANGVYTVVVDGENKRWSKKLIISK